MTIFRQRSAVGFCYFEISWPSSEELRLWLANETIGRTIKKENIWHIETSLSLPLLFNSLKHTWENSPNYIMNLIQCSSFNVLSTFQKSQFAYASPEHQLDRKMTL